MIFVYIIEATFVHFFGEDHLEVKGTPKVTGTITIKLFGGTYGTMSCPGRDFKKVYTIKVEE